MSGTFVRIVNVAHLDGNLDQCVVDRINKNTIVQRLIMLAISPTLIASNHESVYLWKSLLAIAF